jgi:hypothetical protein
MDMIQTKAGLTVASVMPRKNRFVAMPANDLHAGVVMRMIPHTIVVTDTNFPMGSLWSRNDEGNWEIRYPK